MIRLLLHRVIIVFHHLLALLRARRGLSPLRRWLRSARRTLALLGTAAVLGILFGVLGFVVGLVILFILEVND